MTIGQLARAASVNASLIRYYESRGVLAIPRRAGAARRYDAADLAALETVLIARRLGLSLENIREAATGARPLRAIAEARASVLDDVIRRARVTRSLLRHVAKTDRFAPSRYARLLTLVGA